VRFWRRPVLQPLCDVDAFNRQGPCGHVYRDHVDAAREQLEREPYPAPALWLDPDLRGVDDAVARYREIVARAKRGEPPGPPLDGFAKLQNYQYHPPIKAKMAV